MDAIRRNERVHEGLVVNRELGGLPAGHPYLKRNGALQAAAWGHGDPFLLDGQVWAKYLGAPTLLYLPRAWFDPKIRKSDIELLQRPRLMAQQVFERASLAISLRTNQGGLNQILFFHDCLPDRKRKSYPTYYTPAPGVMTSRGFEYRPYLVEPPANEKQLDSSSVAQFLYREGLITLDSVAEAFDEHAKTLTGIARAWEFDQAAHATDLKHFERATKKTRVIGKDAKAFVDAMEKKQVMRKDAKALEEYIRRRRESHRRFQMG